MGKRIWYHEKTLNLVIATGRIEELYEIHKNFASKMKDEVVNEVENGDNIAEFALTISNPTSVKTKGRPKGSNNVNLDIKEKRKQIPEHNQGNKKNKVGRPRKLLQDAVLNVSESSKSRERKCVFVIEKGTTHVLVLKGSLKFYQDTLTKKKDTSESVDSEVKC
ncbi:hypothetical protein C2G38_2040652 [Gigaspora rosea]|uniref:Uncharacterized protein n=1 Tax=Gigaspora rosea TaxID=44941 RepID=A0A397UUE3_9GLOM|nr:hypothetical protein C2G38_2040652 [Gigaspora rosea]